MLFLFIELDIVVISSDLFLFFFFFLFDMFFSLFVVQVGQLGFQFLSNSLIVVFFLFIFAKNVIDDVVNVRTKFRPKKGETLALSVVKARRLSSVENSQVSTWSRICKITSRHRSNQKFFFTFFPLLRTSFGNASILFQCFDRRSTVFCGSFCARLS